MFTAILAAALLTQCPGGVCPPRVAVQAPKLDFTDRRPMEMSHLAVPTTRRRPKASGQRYSVPPTRERRGFRLFIRVR